MYQKKDAGQHHCVCSDPHYIVAERKTLSHIVALALLIGFFIFVSGYFLGKRSATQEFLHQFEQESFADRISHSLHTQYSPHAAQLDSVKQPEAQTTVAQIEEKVVPEPKPAQVAQEPVQVAQTPAAHTEVEAPTTAAADKPQTKPQQRVTYYAQLFGGTRDAAQRFVDLLSQRGITTRMIQKSSKTARSNMVYWYQVETDKFADRTALEDLVSTIKRIAKLHDVKIIKG